MEGVDSGLCIRKRGRLPISGNETLLRLHDLLQLRHFDVHFLHRMVKLRVVHHRWLKQRHHDGRAFIVGNYSPVDLPRRLRVSPDVVEHSKVLHSVDFDLPLAKFCYCFEPSVPAGLTDFKFTTAYCGQFIGFERKS